MITITLDTNCINAKRKDVALNALESLEAEGKVKIYKTDVMATEMQGKYSPGIRKSQQMEEDIGVFILDNSRLDHGFLGTDDDDKVLTEILTLLFGDKSRSQYNKNEMRDAMMVKTHMENGRTFLVTKDQGILNQSFNLKRKFNVEVLEPKNCLLKIARSKK